MRIIISVKKKMNSVGNPLDQLTRNTDFVLILALLTLENHCTQTIQSLCGGCSGCVHKIEYLAVNKGNIWSIFYL